MKYLKLTIWLLIVITGEHLRLRYFPPRPGVVLAEPFSLTAFFISLALSAASYAVQRFLGPKPPKVTRGQMQGELFIQNAEEGTVIPEIYGGAPSQGVRSATWTNLTQATVNSSGNLENDNSGADNCFTDASGTGDSGAWTVETITGGDFEVSWKFGVGRSFVGLTNGSFTLDYTQWDYTIHLSTEANTSGTPHPANSLFVYQGSPPNLAFADGVWVEGDTLRITCESGVVKYWHKQNLLYTSLVAPSYPLHVVASMACHDSTIEDLVIATPSSDTNGGIKTAGNVIWCKSPTKVVTREKKGGKGAPKQTVETITYYTNLAILFGRGRLRLKKLWANADLILDLDAGIGQATGAVDSGAGGSTSYTQDAPPSATTDNSTRTFWGIRLSEDPNGTMSGSLGAGGGTSMRWYTGNYDQLPDSLIEADVGAGNAPAYRGYAILVIENFNLSKHGGVPTFLATLENMDYDDLAEIADHLCERVGIEPGDKDFDVFDGENVRGLIVAQTQAPRQTLELAGTPYQAEFYETVDGLLTGVYLGGASVVTIDSNDLGMAEGDAVSTEGGTGTKQEFTILDDVQIPRQLSVTAFNPEKDHETTTQHAYRMTGEGVRVEQLSLQMALSPDETRRAAEYLLYKRHVERQDSSVKLPWKYAYLNPTDIVEVVSAGITHRLRATQINGSVPGLLEYNLAADQLEVYSQTIAGDGGSGYTPPTVSVPVESIAFLIDSVTLRDSDDKAGFYAAIAPKSASAGWGGAVLYKDRGSGFEVVERFLTPAIAGVIVGAVTSQDEAVWDEVTTVTIDLYGTDATLESLTEAEVLNGGNAACIGQNQIIQFQNAVQVGGYDNRWTISRILWGRRGSDHSAGTYADGSRFVLLDGAVLFIENSLTEKDIARDFKAVTAGYSLTDTASTSMTWTANILKPLSVVDVQGSRDGGNDLTITWTRRSRIGHETPYSGADLPLGEQYERYEIDIYDGVTVVRTITVSDAATTLYTAAEQTADGLTPGDPVDLKIYQISATVGRGFERSATI